MWQPRRRPGIPAAAERAHRGDARTHAGPIFAGLATATLMTGDGSVIGGPILWAALGSLLASPAHSLFFWLLAGAAGHALGALLR
jgi:hypothetical protein